MDTKTKTPTRYRLLFSIARILGYHTHIVNTPYQPKQVIFTRKGFER